MPAENVDPELPGAQVKGRSFGCAASQQDHSLIATPEVQMCHCDCHQSRGVATKFQQLLVDVGNGPVAEACALGAGYFLKAEEQEITALQIRANCKECTSGALGTLCF